MSKVFLLMAGSSESDEVLAVYTSKDEAEKARQEHLRRYPTDSRYIDLYITVHPLYDKFEVLEQHTRYVRMLGKEWVEDIWTESLPNFEVGVFQSLAHPDSIFVQGQDLVEVEEEYNRLKEERGI